MRLIDADALVKKINEEGVNQMEQFPQGRYSESAMTYGHCASMIMYAPTIEKRGEWINIPRHPEEAVYVWGCSVCGFTHDFGLLNYCPTCGAKMGEGE